MWLESRWKEKKKMERNVIIKKWNEKNKDLDIRSRFMKGEKINQKKCREEMKKM